MITDCIFAPSELLFLFKFLKSPQLMKSLNMHFFAHLSESEHIYISHRCKTHLRRFLFLYKTVSIYNFHYKINSNYTKSVLNLLHTSILFQT